MAAIIASHNAPIAEHLSFLEGGERALRNVFATRNVIPLVYERSWLDSLVGHQTGGDVQSLWLVEAELFQFGVPV